MIPLLLLVFRISPKTSGKQTVVYRPTMLKWNSRHMTSFTEETGDHLVQSSSLLRTTFIGFGLSLKTTRLAILILAHKHRSMVRLL